MGCLQYLRLLFIGGALVIAAQYGSSKSVDGRIKPDFNVRGALTESTGQQYALDNITIAGRYAQIPVYNQPFSKDDNPENSTAFLDLESIDEIKRDAGIVRYKDRDYIAIDVFFKGTKKTHNRYIIPRTYIVRATEFLGNDTRSIDRDFSFLAIKSLKIVSILPQNCTRSVEIKADQLASMEQIISTTKKLIEELEKTTDQLPGNNNDFVGDLKKHITYLIKELKNTVNNWFK